MSSFGDNTIYLRETGRIRIEKTPHKAGLKFGRRERIRTSDPLVPNQLRYQAALLADILLFEFFVQFIESCGARGGT